MRVMSFDSFLITYAVSLHFSQEVNKIITSSVYSIAKTTGNRFIIENKIPPHMTIGAFHSTKKNEPKLLQLVGEFSKNQKSGIIQFSEIGNFNNKVLFLKPEKDQFLSEINKKLHELILPKFEKGENGYYTPENWVPHTTLATRLNQKQHTEILNIASKIKLPLESNISEVAVYQCSPFAEMKRFDLKG